MDSKPAIVVTPAQLVAIFEQTASKGAEPIGLDYVAPVEMRKTGNTFLANGNVVVKVSTVSGMVGTDYEAAVNRQREREGATADFDAKPRSWGAHDGGALVFKDGKAHSIQLQLAPNHTPVVEYLCDGKHIDKAALEPWLPVKKPGGEAQGVDREVVVRAYRLDRIRAVRMRGVEYTVAPEN